MSDLNTYNVEYDYNSIMHYGGYEYSSSSSASITAIAGGATMGLASDFSYLDYIGLNLHYKCYG